MDQILSTYYPLFDFLKDTISYYYRTTRFNLGIVKYLIINNRLAKLCYTVYNMRFRLLNSGVFVEEIIDYTEKEILTSFRFYKKNIISNFFWLNKS